MALASRGVGARAKTLLVLGAGPLQVPGIRKALDLGYHVISLDYLPDNVGHRYSHSSVDCSTIDKHGVLDAARELGVDGIVTFSSDVAVPTVAYVAEELGLPGPTPSVVRRTSNKAEFRHFQMEAGIPHPRFLVADDASMVGREISDLVPPIIVKPVDSSGSRGVARVDDPLADPLEEIFKRAFDFSREGRICVEELVDGVEVGGDGIVRDGEVAFLAVTHKHMERFLVRGHSIPTNIGPEDEARVRRALQRCCQHLAYTDGPFNFDVIVDRDEVVILELSARTGGNGIPAVIDRAFGVDVEAWTILWGMGGALPSMPSRQKPLRGAGSYIFGSEIDGWVVGGPDTDALKEAVPEVFEVASYVDEGDPVQALTHNGNMLGYALFDCEGPRSYERISGRIDSALDLRVEPDGS